MSDLRLFQSQLYAYLFLALAFLRLIKGRVLVRKLSKRVLLCRLVFFPVNRWDSSRRVLVLCQSQSHPCSLSTRLRTIWDEIQLASSESCMNFSSTPITEDSCSSRLFVPFIFMSICCHRSSVCDTCDGKDMAAFNAKARLCVVPKLAVGGSVNI